ncbi:MAG: 50S ribosomal protein L14 [Candidatus Woesebacteria bacterium GW2011_GWB1_43_14]|uniref:Large ribosomal subunit protein uL14 n=1 Tax=Candidatus Woesebacteria bacterium GW2011_GWB1_43_14 TaxID=1618578 RepID=A0A0G1DI90_9BACT|nr:MAG: 50S ribosomal protein L14 [Candidatus Woesebacteria bacterium GW2011_GWA1_39_11b]KKS78026.1 MAG: 50S ribosomal protein L14 [Candidatus Woesebacteria bacterium GW2011_GWC1_42_9]KKS97394.1 MAG: 50S ribosomal protein L14 [Candidatus Woesebacteria bacterium GW2011_GWB1_43_14]
MVQLRSRLNLADNSGAKQLMVIGISVKIGKKATLGQVVQCSVKGADPNGTVSNKEKVKAVIVRTKKEVRRKDGTYIRFDDNAAVIIDKQGLPLGTRVLGPIAREVKDAGYTKIASLAKEVV